MTLCITDPSGKGGPIDTQGDYAASMRRPATQHDIDRLQRSETALSYLALELEHVQNEAARALTRARQIIDGNPIHEAMTKEEIATYMAIEDFKQDLASLDDSSQARVALWNEVKGMSDVKLLFLWELIGKAKREGRLTVFDETGNEVKL